jgi:hypothetical protein
MNTRTILTILVLVAPFCAVGSAQEGRDARQGAGPGVWLQALAGQSLILSGLDVLGRLGAWSASGNPDPTVEDVRRLLGAEGYQQHQNRYLQAWRSTDDGTTTL